MKQKCSDDNDDDDENLMLVKRGKGKKKKDISSFRVDRFQYEFQLQNGNAFYVCLDCKF